MVQQFSRFEKASFNNGSNIRLIHLSLLYSNIRDFHIEYVSIMFSLFDIKQNCE